MNITSPQPPEGGLLTAAAIAAIFAVQPKTIHNWADSGRIPVAIRVGHTIRFNLDDVMQALDEETRDAQLARVRRKIARGDTLHAPIASLDSRAPHHDQDLPLPG